jgi:hypothetical protein
MRGGRVPHVRFRRFAQGGFSVIRHRKVVGIGAALVALVLVACGGSGGVSPSVAPNSDGALPQTATRNTVPVASSSAESSSASLETTAAPAGTDAAAIAEGRPPAQAHADSSNLTVSPKSLRFTSSTPQSVKVTVSGPTIVLAASADTKIATVSPFIQSVKAKSGGTLSFTVTPRTTQSKSTFVCFLDAQWRYACVSIAIGAASPPPASPSPPPSPTPTPTVTPTAAPTPIGNGNFSINPASPFAASLDSNQVLAISEGNYSGLFTVVSATATNGADCGPEATPGSYDCGLGHYSDVIMQPTSNSAYGSSLAVVTRNSTSGIPAYSATFTVSDQQGHTALYEVDVPGT